MKLKAAEESGMTVEHIKIPSDEESGAFKGTGVKRVLEAVKKPTRTKMSLVSSSSFLLKVPVRLRRRL